MDEVLNQQAEVLANGVKGYDFSPYLHLDSLGESSHHVMFVE